MKQHQLGSVVLGINDGLIELTGALVGLTFALPEHSLVALAGLITGIAASLSMAASAFMQARHDEEKNASAAALITGVSYLLVVLSLVAPYFILEDVVFALFVMFGVALIIIAATSWLNARYLKQRFIREFGLMFMLSTGVAVVSFLVGNLANRFFLPRP